MSRFRALALLLVGACGDGREIGVDASVVDAAPAGQLVKLRYIAPSQTIDAAAVIFQNEDSTIAAVTATDRSGIATARMSGPGSVSVVVTRGGSRMIYTYMGVEPGDEVVVDDRLRSEPHAYRTFTLGIPPVPDGSFYSLATSCGDEPDVTGAVDSSQLVGGFNNMVDCSSTMDLLVQAFGIETSYIFKPDVPVVESNFVRLLGPYRPFDLNDIQVVGIDSANNATVQLRAGTLGDQRVRPSLLAEVFDSVLITNGSGSASYTTPVPPDSTRMYDVLSQTATPGVAHLASWGPGTPSVTLDLGRDMPRDYLTTPVYSATDHTITWTEPDTGRLADAVFAVIEWDADIGNYQWHIQAPRSDTPTLTLPTLPDALSPRGNFVRLAALSNVTTDRGFEGIGRHLLGSWAPGSLWPADTASGEVRSREMSLQLLPPRK